MGDVEASRLRAPSEAARARGMGYATPDFIRGVEERLGEKSLAPERWGWDDRILPRQPAGSYPLGPYPHFSDYIDEWLASRRGRATATVEPGRSVVNTASQSRQRHRWPVVDKDGQPWCPLCGDLLFVQPEGKKTLYRCMNLAKCTYEHSGQLTLVQGG